MTKNNQNTENLFFIDIKNDCMECKDHKYNLDINDTVLFDKSIKAEPNSLAIIKNYQNEHTIVLLKETATSELVGVYINPKYNDLVIDIKEVVAIGIEVRKPARFLRG
ncbi:hypothetical protein [Francisella philomiragia]|uniref:hypothetical protein n=1 Tax=Francisella philomiragia TaxID=28110 RepID=UPI0022442B8D|nr:hypothetical protein [Francisella philomiragia]